MGALNLALLLEFKAYKLHSHTTPQKKIVQSHRQQRNNQTDQKQLWLTNIKILDLLYYYNTIFYFCFEFGPPPCKL